MKRRVAGLHRAFLSSLLRCVPTVVLASATAASLLLVSPAVALADGKPTLITSVVDSHQQHVRWVTAFNGWRSAKRTWPGETEKEAELRRETRLLILPTPTPMVSRHRELGRRAIVLSSGLIALLDEMLLAEAVSEPPGSAADAGRNLRKDCFYAYGQRVLVTVNLNRDARNLSRSEPLEAWPRLSKLVATGKAHSIGEVYESKEARNAKNEQIVKEAGEARKGREVSRTDEAATGSPCRMVTPALLRSPGTISKVAESADTLAMWLFTQQNLHLARLPPVDSTKAGESASGPLLDARVRMAVASIGLRDSRTAAWLSKHMWLFDGGSRPYIKP